MIIHIDNNKGLENYRIPMGTEVIFIRGTKNCNTFPCFISSGVIVENTAINAIKEHGTDKIFLPYDSQIIHQRCSVSPVEAHISIKNGDKV